MIMIAFVLTTIEIVAQTMPISSVTEIESNSKVKVNIYYSTRNEVEIKSSNAKVNIEGNKLVVFPFSSANGIESDEINVYSTNINSIIGQAVSQFEIKDSLFTDFCRIELSGASELKGKVIAKKIIVDQTGATDIKLAGKTNELQATISGSSDFKAKDLETKIATINVSGASDATITVTEDIKATASGASDIRFAGNPKNVLVDVSGSSEIKPLDSNAASSNNNNYNYEYNYDYRIEDNTEAENPQNQKKFFVPFKHMYGNNTRYRQDLVWVGLDLGINGYVDQTNGFEFQPQGNYSFMEQNYWRNANFRINFFEWRMNIVKNVFNIVTGLGWDFQHYSFAQKIKFDEANDYPGMGFVNPVVGLPDTIHAINRSRLAVQYFTVPIFLNFRTHKNSKTKNQFNFSVGVVGGIRTGASSRITYTENGEDVREEKFDDFNLNTFTATGMVRIKYSFFSMYASYTFTPMFRSKNPNLYPFSIGVTLLSW